MSNKCPNKSHPLYKKYEEAIGEDRTYQLYYENDYMLPDYTKHPLFESLSENLSETNVIRSIANLELNTPEVNYSLKATSILQSSKAEKIFEKGEKNNWNLKKILTELQIPKEQKKIILDTGLKDRSEIVTELATNYSFTVETKLAKKTTETLEELENLSDEQYEQYGSEDIPTQHYSQLTVPGGTNYTENRIITPQIIPSIKGHAAFADNNDIGWFRSDEHVRYVKKELEEGPFVREYTDAESTNTRRILEFQSDLFQKGRGKDVLIKEGELVPGKKYFDLEAQMEYEIISFDQGASDFDMVDVDSELTIKYEDGSTKILSDPLDWDIDNLLGNSVKPKSLEKIKKSKNNFLQLLMKKNNWQTFFIKSIVQDSAKKGYEKVLFPKGDTIAKIEGHETLEEFKKQKEDRLKKLQEDLKEGRYEEGQADREALDFGYLRSINDLKAEIDQIEKELKDVEEQGFAVLNKVAHFYENAVTNILNKQFDNVEVITDEYGNSWNEITIDQARDISPILFRLSDVIPVTNENIDVLGLNEFSPNEYAEISNQLLPTIDITDRADITFLKKRFPDAPVDFYEGIQHVGSQVAHGYMKNAAFHIWTNSEIGTGYHEAFHGLTQLYFNPEQRSSLYDVAFEEYNIDRSNELAIEEQLAEKFRDYMLLQESAGLPNKIVQFFKSLYYYIRALVTNSVSIDQAYTMLETGRIPQQLKRNIERFNPGGTLYSLRPNYTEKLQRDVLNTVFDIYERQRETNLKLRKAKRKTEKELLDQLDNYFFANTFSQKDGSPIAEDAKAKVLDIVDAMKKKDGDRINELKAKYTIRTLPSNEALSNLPKSMRNKERISDIMKHYLDVAINWEGRSAGETGNFTTPGWKDIFIDFLPEYGYEYSQVDDHIGAQDVQERIFDRSALEESMRDKLSGRIKAMLATIPDGSGVTVMGTPRRIDPAKAYSDILQEVSGSTSYQQMLNRLRDASVYKPYLGRVADRIELSDDNNIKSQFTYNFNQHYTDFMRIRRYRDTVSLFSSNRNNLKIKVLDSWRAEAFSDPEITDENIYIVDNANNLSINRTQFNKLKAPYQVLQSFIRDSNQTDVTDTVLDAFVNLLQGLSIGQNVPLKEYAKAYIETGVQIRETDYSGKSLVQYLFNNLKSVISSFANVKMDNKTGEITEFSIKQSPKNFYEDGSNNHVLEVLAEMQVKHQTNMVESFLDANKKTIYPFNMPTQLSDAFQQMKEGTYFEDFLKDDHYNPTGEETHQSPLVRLFVNSTTFKQNTDWKKLDAYQTRDGEGQTFRDQGELLASTVGITSFLNQGDPAFSYFSLPTQSDRDFSPWIKIPRIQKWKKFGLSDISTTRDIIRNEILSQVAVARNAKEAVDTLGPEDHVASYHFKFNKDGSRNYSTGNAIQLTGLLEGLQWKKIDGKEITTIDPKLLVEHEQFDSIVDEYLSEFTQNVNRISKDIETWLLDQQVFANKDGRFIDTEGESVDSFFQANHPFGKHVNTYDSLNQLVTDYTLNSMVINNELQKIFYQSRDFYKNLDDFYKRAGLLTTPGLKPVIKGDIAPDWGLKKDIPEIIIKDVVNKGDDSLIHTYAKAIDALWADDYLAGKSNKSDAQGFMSIHGYKDWLQAFGEWADSHQEAYDNYTTIQENGEYGKFVDNQGNYPTIKPIKPSVMGPMSVNVGENLLTVPVSIKNSYVVLLREYTNTAEGPLSYIDNLRKRMEAEGEYAGEERIDWANTESTHKMYQRGLVDITTQSDLSDVAIHRIPSSIVRVPQVKPEKKSKTVLLASQPLRLLTTLINPVTTPYKVGDVEMSREQMLDTYHKVINQKIARSTEVLRGELGYHPTENFDKVQMLKNLREYLKEQNRNSNRPLSDNQVKAMDIVEYGDQADFAVPFAFPAFARKNEQMLFSLFRNNLIQQETYGKQAVQVADMGGVNNAHNDLAFITPEGERVAEGVLGSIAKAEVAVSADFADMLGIKEGDNLADISEEAKTLLGFRIPTSGKNLMIPMVVKRILPRNYSSTVIVPGRITTQMGSDFDIDTLFVYAPRNIRRKGELTRRKYNLTDISKNNPEQLDNIYFDLMESILTNPDHFAEMIQPLEGGILEGLAENYKQKIDEQKAERYKNPNSPFANIDYQLRNRDGSIGIGIYSNALMGISTAQHMGIEISEKKSIKIKDGEGEIVLNRLMPANDNGVFVDLEGNFIEHNITAHQVASIDNAKDPIMHYLNDNLATMPVTLFMLSSGLDLVRTTKFRNHPLIRRFVQEYENKQAKPYQIKEIAQSIVGTDTFNQASVPVLDFNDLSSHSDAELLKAFSEFHTSGTEFMKLSNIITPNRISDMSSNAALAEYFDDINYVNTKLTTYAIDSGNQSKIDYLDSLYPMNKGYRNAIQESVDFAENFFPFNTSAVQGLKSDLYDLIGRDKLGKDIHKQYHDFMFATMVSMDAEGKLNIDPDYVSELLLQRANNPSLVNRVFDLKKENPNFANNPFIQALSKNRYNYKETIKMFEFNTPVHYDKNESNILTEAFKQLYFDENFQDIAADLAYYSVFTTGFSPAPNSFVSLIPVEVWKDMGMDGYFRQNLQALKDQQDTFLFSEMNYDFIRNNVDTKGFLHSLQLEEGEHKKQVLDLTHKRAEEIGALYENKVKKFVRAYNPDSKEFDLWVFDSKKTEGQGTNYVFKKSGKKGVPYRLTEVNLSDQSIVLPNSKQPLLSPPQNTQTFDQRKSPMYNFKSKELTLKKTFEDLGMTIYVEHVPDLAEHGTIRTKERAIREQKSKIESLESVAEENRSFTHTQRIKEAKEKLTKIENLTEDVYIELRDIDNVESRVHEFGHIYTELLGRDSKIIKEGIEQLRDGELWKEIHKLYWDYSPQDQAMETLVTAIGQEGAKYLQQPWWKAWWNRMLNKLKEILGIERNIAQQLAQEMLHNDLRPVNTSKFIFDRTLRHKDAMKFENSKKMVQDVILSLDRQIESLRQLSTDSNKAEQQRANLRSKLEKILDEKKGIEQEVRGVQLFIEQAHSELRRVNNEIDKMKYETPTDLMKKAGEMLQIMEDYQILDMIKQDAGPKLKELGDGVTMDLLQYTIDFRDNAKEGLNDIVIPKMAVELSSEGHEAVKREIDAMIENVEKGNLDTGLERVIKKTRRYREIERENIPAEEKRHKVLELAKDHLRKRIASPENLETYLREAVNGNKYFLWMVDPILYSNDQVVQLFALMVKNKLAESRRMTVEHRKKLENMHKRFVEKTDRQGWNNELVYDFMLEDTPYSTVRDGERTKINRRSFAQPYDLARFDKKKTEVFNKLNKEFNIPEDITYKEWAEANPDDHANYKGQLYERFYKDNMTPKEGWGKIRDNKWNKLNQSRQELEQLTRKEELTSQEQQNVDSLRTTIGEIENFLEDNFADYPSDSGKPSRPIRQLSRPSTGEGTKADYTNAKYQQIQNNPVLKEFYDQFLNYFKELQEIYGLHNFDKNLWDEYSYYIPSVRKTMKDRLIENGIKDSTQEFFRTFTTLDTDDVYGQYVDNRKRIPIYYANAVDSRDVSNDIPSTLLLFAKQAEEYKQLTDALGHVLVMRNILENRRIPKTDSRGNWLMEKAASIRGWVRNVDDSVPASETKQFKQWEEWVDRIFYGITDQKEYIPGTNIELNKVIRKMNAYSAFNVFPMNILQSGATSFLGHSYIMQEALSAEHFDKKNYVNAGAMYLKAASGLLMDQGLTAPVSKLGQLIDLFDVQEGMTMQNMSKDVFNTRGKNLTSTDQAFFMQRIMEQEMAIRPFLAIMDKIKVTDADGNTMSLYDAYQIKSDGRIGLKKGVTLSKKEMNDITNKVNALNRHMQGVYDKFNAAYLKSKWYGPALLLFRSWLLPTFRRFWGYNQGDYHLDHEMGSIRDGIYKTGFRFFTDVARGHRERSMDSYKNLSNVEQRNVKKFIAHMAMLGITFGLISVLKAREDEEEISQSRYYGLYWSHRLRSELMIFLMPHTEGLKLLRSPAASTMMLDKITKFGYHLGAAPLDLLIDGDVQRYQRRVGQFEKGTPKLYKRFRDLVPGLNAWDNSRSPEEAYKWYTSMF